MKKKLELYIHIPFCVKKCAYCDFLSGPADEKTKKMYVEALVKEIYTYRRFASDYVVTTIFVGGGTPTALESVQMVRVFEVLKEVFEINVDAEITIEANPGTVTIEKLSAYKNIGINRISFGLQSVKNEELKMLGRIHAFEDFMESYKMARHCGFDNINVDLISAIPGQTLQSWEETLKTIIGLQPEHVSAYSLIIEEGTPFALQYGEGMPGENLLPSEEEERAIYNRTEEILNHAGYNRYEISNYAKKGRECKHNLGYWERKEYLGLGLGASSLIDNMRFHNTEDMKEYIDNSFMTELIRKDTEKLSELAQREEFLFLGLRKTAGVSLAQFEKEFGISMMECYGEVIERLQKEGLLKVNDDRMYLTAKGIDVSNYVFVELLA